MPRGAPAERFALNLPEALLPRRSPWGVDAALLDRVALIAALLTPLFLMHGHAIAEATMGIAGACFLGRGALGRDWAWLRTGWVALGIAWWGWLVVCSLVVPGLGLGEGGVGSTVQ